VRAPPSLSRKPPEAESATLDGLQLRKRASTCSTCSVEEAARISRYGAGGHAVAAELGDRMLPGPGEQRPLVERGGSGAPRRGGNRNRRHPGRPVARRSTATNGADPRSSRQLSPSTQGGRTRSRPRPGRGLLAGIRDACSRLPGRSRRRSRSGDTLLDPVGRKRFAQATRPPRMARSSVTIAGELQLHPVDERGPPTIVVANHLSGPLTAGIGRRSRARAAPTAARSSRRLREAPPLGTVIACEIIQNARSHGQDEHHTADVCSSRC